MKRTSVVFLTTAVLLAATHRLPAPISENPEPTATPKPKTTGIHRPPKPRSISRPVAAVSFAGTWIGTASGEMHAPLSPPNYSCDYRVQVSPDEKTVNWTASKWLWTKFQAPVQKNGARLRWTYEKHDIAGQTMISSSLQMNPNGTATFAETSNLVNGLFKDSGYKVSGIFTRQ